MENTKKCGSCSEVKPTSEFRTRGDRNCLRYKCIECERAYNRIYTKNRDPEHRKAYARAYYHNKVKQDPKWAEGRRARKLAREYGITPEEYRALHEKQGGVCAICDGKPYGKSKHLHVDHCHETGAVRGLLCHNCNLGLGSLGDTVSTLRRALNYLLQSGSPEVQHGKPKNPVLRYRDPPDCR